MKLLTKEQQESNENEEICYICKEKFEIKYRKDKKYPKVRYYCHYTGKYRGAVHSKWNVLKNPIFFLQWIKVWLSFYHERVSRRI